MNSFDYNQIKIIPATINDYQAIQNMARFYVYDMSEYLGDEEGWEMPEDGLYECIDFKKYWETDNAFPFLIRYKSELVGFAIVDKKGSEPAINFNMAQFFIIRKFKNKGIGKFIAHELFNRFRGIWEVMVIPENLGAYQFWNKTIGAFSKNVEKYNRHVAHFENNLKKIFKFTS